MRKLRIGYQPLSKDLSHPGDRRRLVFWAKNRGHEIITDLTQKMDVLLVSEKGNLNPESTRVYGAPVVLDLVDAYLAQEKTINDWVRGASKVVNGQITGTPRKFTRIIESMCRDAAAVICSSEEQSETIFPYSNNVHVILDSHDELPMLKYSRNARKKVSSILWEGMPATITGLKAIVPTLEKVGENSKLNLTLVTNEEYFLLLNKHFSRKTNNLVNSMFGTPKYSYNIAPWSVRNLVRHAVSSDLAVIPIDLSAPIQYLKPENRLLIMWRLGLPCLTSPSPAYKRVARAANTDAICNTDDEWRAGIERNICFEDYAETQVLNGQEYLRKFHSSEVLLSRWDRAIASVL